jgi:hypothetical protein
VNTQLGFICKPWIVPKSLLLTSGATASTSPVIELASTSPGQIMTFELYLGNSTQLVNVTYGPVTAPYIYGCSSFGSTAFNGHLKVTCTLAANPGTFA